MGANTSAAAPAWTRSVVPVMAAAALFYWAHRMLQLTYHRQCKSNLIRVVLFDQSVMCSSISGVLNLVEQVSSHAVRSATTHVMGTLHAAVAVGIAVASAGAASMPTAPKAAGVPASTGHSCWWDGAPWCASAAANNNIYGPTAHGGEPLGAGALAVLGAFGGHPFPGGEPCPGAAHPNPCWAI